MSISVKDGNGAAVAIASEANAGANTVTPHSAPEIGGAAVSNANPMPSSVVLPLPSGANTIGRTGLPKSTAVPGSSAVISAAGTYQTLFAAGSMTFGAYVQNPASNTGTLSLDVAGATGSTVASTSIDILPGGNWSADFIPPGAVTVLGSAVMNFRAGVY